MKLLGFTAIAASLLAAAQLHGQLIINDSRTATPPGGPGSEWDRHGQVILIGSGPDATGELFVQAGTEVLAEMVDLGVGAPSASGYLDIDGEGAAVVTSYNTAANSIFRVGVDGTGEIAVKNGGNLTSRGTWIAFEPGSTGKLTVDGPNTTWIGVTGGDWRVGHQGEGTLEVTDGAIADGQRNIFIGNVSTEEPEGSGNVVAAGVGHVLVAGGATLSGYGYARMGNNLGAVGHLTVTGEGSTFSRGTYFQIAHLGDGHVEITDGGSVITGTASTDAGITIGGSSTAAETEVFATVHISDPGSLLESLGSWVYVGRYANGRGTLLAENGATVRTATHFRIGTEAGSIGEATFTGEGTLLDIGSYSYIGGGGTATMHVLDGAVVESPTNSLSIAYGPTADATLNISTGGAYNVGSHAYAGREGTGRLNVTEGGSLIGTLDLRIGFAETADGSVTVSGEESIISVDGALRMATGAGDNPAPNNAPATLSISDGAVVHAGAGGWVRSASTITLDGGTLSGGVFRILDTASLTGQGVIDGTLVVGPDATVQSAGSGLSVSRLAGGHLSDVTLGGITASLADLTPISLTNVTMAPNSVIDITINWLIDSPLITFDANTDLTGTTVNIVFDPGEPNRDLSFPLFSGPNTTFASVTTSVPGWEIQDGNLLYTGAVSEAAFSTWAAGHGLNGADAAPGASPAGDGFTNLEKFSLGLNPAVPVPALADVSRDGTLLVLRWNQRIGAGIDYAVETSGTLGAGGWSAVPGASPVVMAAPDMTPPAGYERVEWSVDVSGAGAHSFYRVTAAVDASLLP